MLYTNIIQNPVYAFLTKFTQRTRVHHHNKISLPYKTSSNSIQIEGDTKSRIQLPTSRSESSAFAAIPLGETIQLFIDAAPEDYLLVEELTHYLDEHDYKNCLPTVNMMSGKRSEMLRHQEDNLLKCKTVILPFGDEAPESWLRNHLRFYRKIQARRTSPLKIAVYCPNARVNVTDLRRDFSDLSLSVYPTLENLCGAILC